METMEQLEKKLSKVCQEIYTRGGKLITPMYPWVLVRVLPKEQQIGSIIMVEKQERTLYEGIVLSTWPECDRANSKGKIVHKKSIFEIGDRITFPHFEGMPAGDLDEKFYRFVREEIDHEKFPNCGVFGWIDYSGDSSLKEKLKLLLQDVRMVTVQRSVGTLGR